MNNVQIFSNPAFGQIRTATSDNNEPLFMAFDVAKSLGYADPKQAVQTHCKSGRLLFLPHSNGVGGMHATFITEGDVYRLIMRSQLPSADKFQDWVCDEVIPSIRRTGGYIAAAVDETPEEIMARALLVAQSTIDRIKQQNQILEGENEHLAAEVKSLAPKAEYTDKVLQSTTTYTMTQVAKELGMSAVTLEKKLHDWGVMFKQSGQWLLFSKYQGKGYTKPRTHHYTHSDGSTGTNTITVFTEAGRAFIHHFTDKKLACC